jgi:hypothetical protein
MIKIKLYFNFYTNTYQYWYTVNHDYKFKLHLLETKIVLSIN